MEQQPSRFRVLKLFHDPTDLGKPSSCWHLFVDRCCSPAILPATSSGNDEIDRVPLSFNAVTNFQSSKKRQNR
jgi:hypothetical protein